MAKANRLFGGVIVLYFIIGLEVLIMISPFAAFFYAAFNPFLLFLAESPATRWLASFFLPHMVSPPGLLLQTIRVAGSALFVGGAVAFVVGAGQVYFHKFFRRSPALGGLYTWIRHPQYLALGITGLGLSILWPRFLTIALWTIMVALYYLLARDEERRMLAQFPEEYQAYSDRSGMFFPRRVEQAIYRVPYPRAEWARALLGLTVLAIVVIGGAVALRVYTIAHLPLWSRGRVTAMAVLPDDAIMLEHRMADVLELPEVNARLSQRPGPILVYLIPQHYIMQGMIADTEPRWRLHQHHQTVAMITDWIFHPFRHLQGGHMMMHQDIRAGTAGAAHPTGIVRRLIFLRIESAQTVPTPAALFAINSVRDPLFFADVDMHNLVLQDIQDLGPGTGWGRVPTPMF